MNYSSQIKEILVNEKLVKHFQKRLTNEHYRGLHLYQHTRTTVEEYIQVLTEINKFGKLRVPRGDEYDPNKQQNSFYKLKDFPDYSNFCSKIKEKNGGSPDNNKKILFVNLARMGFLNRVRVNAQGEEVYCQEQSKRFTTDFVSLTHRANKLLQNQKFHSQITDFGKAAISFDKAQKLNEILIYLFSEFKKIQEYEFMFFVVYTELDNNPESLSKEVCVEMIKEWRGISKLQQLQFIDFLRKYSKGSKSKKSNLYWDFGNWKNQTQTIFHTFKDLGLFLINENQIIAPNTEIEKFKKIRDGNIIKNYNKKYNIEKRPDGWEYHHIYQIAFATDQIMLKRIDDYKNIVLISGTLHNKFPKRNNLYTKIEFLPLENKIIFKKNEKEFIEAEIGVDIIINSISEQIEYNLKLQKL